MEDNNVKKILVAIPAFNEASAVTSVIAGIPQSLPGAHSVEILVVDDGSTDDTVKLVKAQGRARVISHLKNRGVGAAFHTAVDYAWESDAAVLVTIDADGQFNPADIPQLVAPILDHSADFVTASRFIDSRLVPQMPKVKLWGNRVVSRLISLLVGCKYHDVSCGFRAYSREAFLRLNLFGKFTYTQEVFLDLSFKGLRIKEVPLPVKYFPGRRSRVAGNVLTYAWKISNIVLASMRDYRPLQFFGLFGALVFAVGLVLDVSVLTHFFRTGAFSPYISAGVAGLLFNLVGLGLVGLGFITDMLARIRMNQEKTMYLLKRSKTPKR
jgi:glycosyltransferase involved in cell wall biosynthesis